MVIYKTIESAMENETGLYLQREHGDQTPASSFESDWGMRLRGAGLPGDSVGWLLTFAGVGSGWDTTGISTGWLMAYAIADNRKTGRVAILRRGWDSKTDHEEMNKARSNSEVWANRHVSDSGEADIDVIDAMIAGAQLS